MGEKINRNELEKFSKFIDDVYGLEFDDASQVDDLISELQTLRDLMEDEN